MGKSKVIWKASYGCKAGGTLNLHHADRSYQCHVAVHLDQAKTRRTCPKFELRIGAVPVVHEGKGIFRVGYHFHNRSNRAFSANNAIERHNRESRSWRIPQKGNLQRDVRSIRHHQRPRQIPPDPLSRRNSNNILKSCLPPLQGLCNLGSCRSESSRKGTPDPLSFRRSCRRESFWRLDDGMSQLPFISAFSDAPRRRTSGTLTFYG